MDKIWGAPVALALTTLLGVAYIAASAKADDFHVDTLTTDKGCFAYFYSATSIPPDLKFQFSGACTAGQPISGKGTFGIPGVTFTGTFVNGVMNGPIVYETEVTDEHSKTSMEKTTDAYDMGCPTIFNGKPANMPRCKQAIAKVLAGKFTPTAAAKPQTTAMPVAVPTPAPVATATSKNPTYDDYKKACAADFASIADAQAMTAELAAMSDADFNKLLTQQNGQTLIDLSENDPRLASRHGLKLKRCLIKTRATAAKGKTSTAIASPAVIAKPAPVAVTPTTAVATTTAAAAASPTAFTAAQVAECDTMIRTLQGSASSWPGTSAEISGALGRQQKEMFTGKCAGHPQAAAFIQGAERMIASGSATKMTAAATTRVHNPANAANTCVKLVQTNTKVEWGTEGRMKFVNQCAFRAAIGWCLTNGECQRGSGNLWSIDPGQSWPVFFVEGTTQVRWGACRSKTGIEFTKGSQGSQYICP